MRSEITLCWNCLIRESANEPDCDVCREKELFQGRAIVAALPIAMLMFEALARLSKNPEEENLALKQWSSGMKSIFGTIQ